MPAQKRQFDLSSFAEADTLDEPAPKQESRFDLSAFPTADVPPDPGLLNRLKSGYESLSERVGKAGELAGALAEPLASIPNPLQFPAKLVASRSEPLVPLRAGLDKVLPAQKDIPKGATIPLAPGLPQVSARTAAGTLRGLTSLAEGFTTGENLAILLATGGIGEVQALKYAPAALDAAFAGLAATQTPEAWQAYQDAPEEDKPEKLVELLGSVGIALLAGKGAKERVTEINRASRELKLAEAKTKAAEDARQIEEAQKAKEGLKVSGEREALISRLEKERDLAAGGPLVGVDEKGIRPIKIIDEEITKTSDPEALRLLQFERELAVERRAGEKRTPPSPFVIGRKEGSEREFIANERKAGKKLAEVNAQIQERYRAFDEFMSDLPVGSRLSKNKRVYEKVGDNDWARVEAGRVSPEKKIAERMLTDAEIVKGFAQPPVGPKPFLENETASQPRTFDLADFRSAKPEATPKVSAARNPAEIDNDIMQRTLELESQGVVDLASDPVLQKLEAESRSVYERNAQELAQRKVSERETRAQTPGEANSVSFKSALDDFIKAQGETRGKPLSEQLAIAKARLEEKGYHPAIVDELTSPERLKRPEIDGDVSEATTRPGRLKRAVEPPPELKEQVDLVADKAIKFRDAEASYNKGREEIFREVEKLGGKIIVDSADGTFKIEIKPGKAKLSMQDQLALVKLKQEAAEAGAYSLATVGKGFQVAAAPLRIKQGESLKGSLSEKIAEFIDRKNALKAAQSDFRKSEKALVDPYTDFYFKNKLEGKENASLIGRGEVPVEVQLRRKPSDTLPDEPQARRKIVEARREMQKRASELGPQGEPFVETRKVGAVRAETEKATGASFFDIRGNLSEADQVKWEAINRRVIERIKELPSRPDAGLLDFRAYRDLSEAGYYIAKALTRASKDKALEFAEWSNEMLHAFGDKIRPLLDEIYDGIVRGFKPITRLSLAEFRKKENVFNLKHLDNIAWRQKAHRDPDFGNMSLRRVSLGAVKDILRADIVETLPKELHDIRVILEPDFTRETGRFRTAAWVGVTKEGEKIMLVDLYVADDPATFFHELKHLHDLASDKKTEASPEFIDKKAFSKYLQLASERRARNAETATPRAIHKKAVLRALKEGKLSEKDYKELHETDYGALKRQIVETRKIGEAKAVELGKEDVSIFDYKRLLSTEELASLDAAQARLDIASREFAGKLYSGPAFSPQIWKEYIEIGHLVAKGLARNLGEKAKITFENFKEAFKNAVGPDLFKRLESNLVHLWEQVKTLPDDWKSGDEVPTVVRAEAVENVPVPAAVTKPERRFDFGLPLLDRLERSNAVGGAIGARWRKAHGILKTALGRNAVEIRKIAKEAGVKRDKTTPHLDVVAKQLGWEKRGANLVLVELINHPERMQDYPLTEVEKKIIKLYRETYAKNERELARISGREPRALQFQPTLNNEAREALFVLKGGPLFEAMAKVTAERSGLELKKVKQKFASGNLSGLDIPTHVPLKGELIAVGSADAISALQAQNFEFARTLGLLRTFGPKWKTEIKNLREKYDQAGGNLEVFDLIEQGYKGLRPKDWISEKQSSRNLAARLYFRAVDPIFSSLALSKSAWTQITQPFIDLQNVGVKNFMKTITEGFGGKLSADDLERMGIISRDILNWKFAEGEKIEDYGRMISALTNRGDLMYAASLLNDVASASNWRNFVNSLAGKKLTAKDRQTLRTNLGLTEAEIQKVEQGKFKDPLGENPATPEEEFFVEMVRRGKTQSQHTGKFGGEKSQFQTGSTSPFFLRFQNYTIGEFQRWRRETANLQKALASGSKEERNAAIGRVLKLVGTTAVQGELINIIRHTIKGEWDESEEGSAVGQALKGDYAQASKNFLWNFAEAGFMGAFTRAYFAYQIAQGSATALMDAFFPTNIAHQLWDALGERGRYADKTWDEKIGQFFEDRIPAADLPRAGKRALALLDLAKEDGHKTDAATRAYFKWLEDTGRQKEFPEKEGYIESRRNFLLAHRALNNGDDEEVMPLLIKGFDAKILENEKMTPKEALERLKTSLGARMRVLKKDQGRLVSRFDKKAMEDLKKEIGEEKYDLLVAHDTRLNRLLESLYVTNKHLARRR